MVNIEPLIDQIGEALTSLGMTYSIIKAGRDSEFDHKERIHIVMSQTFYARSENLDIKCDKLLIDERHVEYDTPRTKKLIENLSPESIIGTSATPYDSNGFLLHGSEIIETATGRNLTDGGFLCPLRYYIPKWAERIDYSKVKIQGMIILRAL